MPEELSDDRDTSGVRVLTAAYERWQEMPPARLNIHRQDAFVTLMGLQQVAAHPEMAGGPMARTWERVGRAIQEAVCDDPELYAIAEAGWSRAFDVDTAREQEGR